MQITIYTKESSLEELDQFLRSEIPYEHSIEFWTSSNIDPRHSDSIMTVQLFYSDYFMLKEWSLKNRTNDSNNL